jgi:AraC-like DNA-binding protein
MLAARRLLTAGALGTAEVAQRVGYDSEFAFAKAFKRFFGEGPGAARRSVARTPAATGTSAS